MGSNRWAPTRYPNSASTTLPPSTTRTSRRGSNSTLDSTLSGLSKTSTFVNREASAQTVARQRGTPQARERRRYPPHLSRGSASSAGGDTQIGQSFPLPFADCHPAQTRRAPFPMLSEEFRGSEYALFGPVETLVGVVSEFSRTSIERCIPAWSRRSPRSRVIEIWPWTRQTKRQHVLWRSGIGSAQWIVRTGGCIGSD